MRRILFLFLILPLLASQCKKEDCSKVITIKNNSDQNVIYSLVLTNGLNRSQCFLGRNAELHPNESYEQDIRVCWELELMERDFEFYIIDPDGFNEGGFYSCDSIAFRNTVLKHYILTADDLDSLKAANFTITYP